MKPMLNNILKEEYFDFNGVEVRRIVYKKGIFLYELNIMDTFAPVDFKAVWNYVHERYHKPRKDFVGVTDVDIICESSDEVIDRYILIMNYLQHGFVLHGCYNDRGVSRNYLYFDGRVKLGILREERKAAAKAA